MSRKTRTLLLTGIVLVLLAGVLGGVLLFHRASENQAAKEAEEAENGILIDSNVKEDIIGFSYTNTDPQYDQGTFVFEKTGEKWVYAGDREFPLLQDTVEAKVEVLEKVYAKRVVEESCGDWSKFGLDAPVLTVSFTDGKTEKTYCIGDYNANAEGYYMCIQGSDTAYLVDGTLWVTYGMDLYDMVQMPAYPQLKADHFLHVTFREAGGETLDFYYERQPEPEETAKPYETGERTIRGDWYIIDGEGNKVPANASRTAILMSSLVDVEYAREVSYKADDAQLEAWQLKEPRIQITIDYTEEAMDESTISQTPIGDNISQTQWDTYETEKQVVLKIGAKTDTFDYTSDYYLQLEGMPEVVTLQDTQAELYSGLKVQDYLAD